MPDYEFMCQTDNCVRYGEVVLTVQTMLEDHTYICASCHSRAERVYSPITPIFRGEDFYRGSI